MRWRYVRAAASTTASQSAPDHPVDSIRFWSDFYRRNEEWSRLLIREGLEQRKGKASHEEEARRYWQAAVDKMRLSTGPDNWPKSIDQAQLLLSLVAIEIVPVAFPHLARQITGKDPTGTEFQNDRREFLRDFAQIVIGQPAPASSLAAGS